MKNLEDHAIEIAAIELISIYDADKSEDISEAMQAVNYCKTRDFDGAIEIILPAIAKGTASAEMQRAAALLITNLSAKGRRGRPATARPPKWDRISDSYQYYRERDLKWDAIILKLMEEFRMGKTRIEDAVRFGIKVEKKIEEILEVGTSQK